MESCVVIGVYYTVTFYRATLKTRVIVNKETKVEKERNEPKLILSLSFKHSM